MYYIPDFISVISAHINLKPRYSFIKIRRHTPTCPAMPAFPRRKSLPKIV